MSDSNLLIFCDFLLSRSPVTSLRELCNVQRGGTQPEPCATKEQVINLLPSSGLTADVTVSLLQHIGLPSLKSRFIILFRWSPAGLQTYATHSRANMARGLLINITGDTSASLTGSYKYDWAHGHVKSQPTQLSYNVRSESASPDALLLLFYYLCVQVMSQLRHVKTVKAVSESMCAPQIYLSSPCCLQNMHYVYRSEWYRVIIKNVP